MIMILKRRISRRQINSSKSLIMNLMVFSTNPTIWPIGHLSRKRKF